MFRKLATRPERDSRNPQAIHMRVPCPRTTPADQEAPLTKHKIRMLLLASVGFTALAAASASAADIPGRSLPPPRAPIFVPFFTWTGFYAGLHAGYAFGDSRWTNAVTTLNTGDFDTSGAMVGGTLGYNWQTGWAVLGVEADVAWSGVQGSTVTNCPLGCETKSTWFGTARGRIGYAFDRFLPYFTGGAAYGDVQANAATFSGTTKTQFGWTIGGGLEYAFLTNWSAKIEYLYVDMGSVECPAASCGATIETTLTLNIVRCGLNYKF